jgi:hypothetical protein
MNKIKLKELIDKQGLDTKELAEQLFPQNKYPRLALNRVLAGGAVLDANQISKLSLLTGIPINELYSGENWKAQSTKGIHVFTNEAFRAELNTETWVTKIFHKESLFHESIIHTGTMKLSEYFEQLNKIITNFKNHESN